MKRYTIIHPFFMSFFSKSLYIDVARNWKGVNFLYLLLLLALCWMPEIVKLHLSLSDYIINDAPYIVKQIPKITVYKGEVSTDSNGPHSIKDPSGILLAVIDTTGQYTSLEETEAHMLLTKTKFMAKKSAKESRIFDLSGIDEFSLDEGRINGWLANLKNWFAILSYPFFVLFSFLYRIIQVAIYAVIGILFVKILNSALDYQVLIRLAVISITPVILIDTVLGLLGTSIPFWWLLCFLIAMGYLFFAVKVNSEEVVSNPS